MKKLLFILLILVTACGPKVHTYKGKFVPGMFNDNPRKHKHRLGMQKIKKQFDHQNINTNEICNR